MESKNYICGGSKFAYSKGYIGLPVLVDGLPDSIETEGETLQKKTSFHVSLLCVKDLLAKKPDTEQIILDTFCAFTNANDISFIKYSGEFRFAKHEERKTLIALCEVSNLNGLFESLGEKLAIEIPVQPTHVTLYTLQPDMGIGLNSADDMEAKSVVRVVPSEVRKALLSVTHQMKLQPSPFEKIKNGTKTIEIRLNDEKRQLLKVGDEIEFALMTDAAQTIKTEVIGLEKFLTFKEMFAAYPAEEYGGQSQDEWELMYKYYPPEEEAKYGVLAIKVKRG